MDNKILLSLGVLILILLLFAGCVQQTDVCGNGVCEASESELTCSADCGDYNIPVETPIVPQSRPTDVGPLAGAPVDCTDTDGGNNSLVFGEVSGVCVDCNPSGVISSNSDICVNQDATGAVNIEEGSNSVMEFYCSSNGWVREVVSCQKTCVNGACVQ